MLKNKWRVLVIAPLLSVSFLAFFLVISEASLKTLPALVESYYMWVMIFSIYGFPLMLVYGFPVHLFASWFSERYEERMRWIISLGIHVVFGLLVFILGFSPIFCALVFFGIGEVVRYLQHEKQKRSLRNFTYIAILFPVLIWTATGIPIWYDSIQVQAEMDRLNKVGHPQPELVVGKKTYPINVYFSGYDSQGEENKLDEEPPKIPEAFYDGMKTITVQPGEIVTIQYKNSPGDYKVRALHWENGNLVKENLTNAQLKAPTEPGVYGYSILADWGRHISRSHFGLEVKAK